MSEYKRGTVVINGKRYGFYPDGSRFRIYEHDVPFLQLVDVDGDTFLRVRQATEQGYTDVPVGGCVDLAYPNSTIRRSRTVGGAIWLMPLLAHISFACSLSCNIYMWAFCYLCN